MPETTTQAALAAILESTDTGRPAFGSPPEDWAEQVVDDTMHRVGYQIELLRFIITGDLADAQTLINRGRLAILNQIRKNGHEI